MYGCFACIYISSGDLLKKLLELELKRLAILYVGAGNKLRTRAANAVSLAFTHLFPVSVYSPTSVEVYFKPLLVMESIFTVYFCTWFWL